MNDHSNLLDRFHKLKEEYPKIRARKAAEKLGVSEAELLALDVGNFVTCLTNDTTSILKEVHTFGEVMASTRNHLCAHDRKGEYSKITFTTQDDQNIAQIVNPDITLRMYLDQWKYTFAVSEETSQGVRKSLQFYDASGVSVHKIYITSASDAAAYDSLVEKYIHPQQNTSIDVEAIPEASTTPIQALEQMGPELAYPVHANAARKVLKLARDKSAELIILVANRGCQQTHSGTIKTIVDVDGYYNILDPTFNFHLKEKEIAQSWITKKLQSSRNIVSLEIFDAKGNLVVKLSSTLLSNRDALKLWHEIIETIPKK